MANLFQPSITRATDSNGDAINGAKLYFYQTGTTTAATWYTNQAGTTEGTNPLVSNAAGVFSPAFLDPAITYRIVLTTNDGSSTIYDVDPVRGFDESQLATAAADAVEAAAATAADRIAVAADRAEAEELVDEVSAALATGTVSDLVGTRIYDSKTALDADLVPADGLYALVVGDATAANNDLYKKSGATTTGSWTGPLGFLASASAEANAAADVATAKAAEVSAAVENLTVAQVLGRAPAPVDGTGLPLGTYVFATPVSLDGTIQTVRVWGRITTTLKLRRFSKAGDVFTQVGSDTDVPIVAGLNEVSVSMAVKAGEYIGAYIPNGSISYLDATGDSGGYYNSTADSTSFTDATVNTGLQLQIGFDVSSPYVTTTRVQGIEDEVTTVQSTAVSTQSGLEEITSTSSLTLENYEATAQYGTSFAGFAGVALLEGVATGTAIKRIGFDRVYVGASATKVRLQIYSRPEGETSAPPTNCTLVFEQDYTLAELGLTAGSATRQTVLFEFPSDYVKGASDHLAWRWEALDGLDARQVSSIGYLTDDGASPSERGWYYASTGAASYSAIPSPSRLSVRVARDRYVLASANGSNIYEGASAEVEVAGANIAVSGTLYTPSGESSTFSATLTPTLAATGKERMDKIVLNRSTGALSLVSGDARDEQLDSLEWQADTPANSLLIARARVTDATVEAVSTADFRGLVKRGTEAEVSWMMERNRRILRPVIGKAMRGHAITLGGYGDSITAIQANTPDFNANGIYRDRATGAYLSNYPADTKALLTLYDTGDGQGQVHTRLGWNWNIKAALDEMAGAEVVTYLNYGIGATTSQSTANQGLDPARIAVPLADGLNAVVIAFGMNERGQTYTYDNIVNMVGQFQAVGTIPIIMGVPRPNANQDVAPWRFTNEALEAAAMDTGSAYISTLVISDTPNLGGIGVPAEALASANTVGGASASNHPGIYELNTYGEAAVLQLGLS